MRVRPLPISIPYQRFQQMAEQAPDSRWTELKVILGVDRLDYTKATHAHRLQPYVE